MTPDTIIGYLVATVIIVYVVFAAPIFYALTHTVSRTFGGPHLTIDGIPTMTGLVCHGLLLGALVWCVLAEIKASWLPDAKKQSDD